MKVVVVPRVVAACAAAPGDLALADWDCRDQTGYDVVVAEIRDELEQEYVDARKPQLDALVERWVEDTE